MTNKTTPSQKRPFAVFDIDGTLIRWQLFHAVVDELARLAHIDQAVYDIVCASRTQWRHRQEEEAFSAYEIGSVTAIHDALTSIPPQTLEVAMRTVFDTYKDQTHRYTRQLIQDLRANGYLLFAISGSMDGIVGMVADYYGFDDYVGTRYVSDGKKFTGEVVAARSHAKPRLLRQLVEKHHATYEGSIGIGDGEGDIAMLDTVEHPTAFNPSKLLFAHAQQKGWKIVLERKNMIYELERTGKQYTLVEADGQ